MAYIYLFRVASLICEGNQSAPATKNYAVLSKKRKERLESLETATITGVFNERGLQYDIIQFKSIQIIPYDKWKILVKHMILNPRGKLSIFTDLDILIYHNGYIQMIINSGDELDDSYYKICRSL